jgi:hypothetical protein
MSQLWLDSLNIPEGWRERKLKIGNRRFIVDALDKDNKIVYEFNGDFWHGNPEIYNLDDVNPATKTTYRKLYKKTKEKEKLIINAGYRLISIWESKFSVKRGVICQK